MNFNCPQCGISLGSGSRQSASNTKLSSCLSCNSSLLIENDSISLSELNVAKNTEKSLFEIDNTVHIKNTDYTPQGYCIYECYLDDEKNSMRVEWELSCADGKTYFLNQEDENLFLVKQIPTIQQTLPVWESLQPNTQLKIEENEWLVVEQLQVGFVSYYGALQNLPLQNIKLKCTYLSNTQGECLVLTFNNHNGFAKETHKAYQGWWLDPMDLT